MAPEVSLPDLVAPREAQEKYRNGLARQKEGRHQEGRRHFLAAIEIYPEYSAAYAGLGISLLQLQEREEALEALKRALELNPASYDAQLCTGLILNDLKRFSEARDCLQAARRLNSRDWRVHYELGRMYHGLNRFSEAEHSLRLARRSRPRYGNLYLLLGNTFALEGKYAEAIVEFEEFLAMAPSNPAGGEVRKKLALLRAEVESHKSRED
jgi:tetratricopeptide (TPR) repeat protein